MLRLQLWTFEQSEAGSGPVSVQAVQFEDIQTWLSDPPKTALVLELIWRTELVVLHTTDHLADDEGAIECLVEALGYAPLDAFTITDTVEFNFHLPEWQKGDVDATESVRRCYSVSDNMFGICWMWDPSKRHTRGLMYGCIGEGSRQIEYMLHRLPMCHQLRANPLVLGLLTLEGEVVEMKRWIASQSLQLLEAQVNTEHHAYANTERRVDFRAMGLDEYVLLCLWSGGKYHNKPFVDAKDCQVSRLHP